MALAATGPSSDVARREEMDATARLRAILTGNHALVYRILRRLGVGDAWVDDAVSRVFDVVHRRLRDIEVGRERSFVTQVAVRVAADARKARLRRAEVESPIDGRASSPEASSLAPSPEDALARQEALALLDRVLEAIETDAREVFVLHEIEQLTMAEIASALGVPAGTVASRLRRARLQFESAAKAVRRDGPSEPRGAR